VASFRLVPENLGSWVFLQLGAYKSGVRNLLWVSFEDLRELVLPSIRASYQLVLENLEFSASYECKLLYIRKYSMVFSNLGFHINYDILCICGYFLCSID